MKKLYEKSQDDAKREEADLRSNPIMRWLQNQEAFRFNPGDVLIKKTRRYTWNPQSHTQNDEWVTEVITRATNAPKKYVFCFENVLGIGYIKQLKAKGDGTTGQLICVANFDPENTRLELDPDFVDHQLIGDGDFQYNQEYAAKRKFRDEAIANNRKILIKTSSKKPLIDWYLGLKPGDHFWFGHTFDDLVESQYKVVSIKKGGKPAPRPQGYYGHSADRKEKVNQDYLGDKEWQVIEVEVVKSPWDRVGSRRNLTIGDFSWAKVTMQQPFPMKDPLCDRPK